MDKEPNIHMEAAKVFAAILSIVSVIAGFIWLASMIPWVGIIGIAVLVIVLISYAIALDNRNRRQDFDH